MHRYLATLLAAAAVALLAASAGQATPPSSGTGTIVIASDTTTNVRQADGNTFITQSETGVLTGVLSGPYTLERTITVFADGATSIHATATCACTVAGRTGILTDTVNGRGAAGEPIVAQLTITGATGGLDGLHGEGTVVAGGAGITYTLSYHFDP
jgi:hypothetical protein